jgi:hypothetical protein
LAIFLPIVSMLLVPARNDKGMVGGHALLVIGNYVLPRHHPHTVAGRFA